MSSFPKAEPAVKTLFSEARFIQALARAGGAGGRPVEIRGRGKLSGVSMFGMQQPFTFGRRHLSFAPFGLYAYPSSGEDLQGNVRGLLEKIRTWRTTGFEWNVRYDHPELAKELQACGISFSESTTYVLDLSGEYEKVFAGFNATIRNQVRRAQREGVVVRRAEDDASVEAYYQIHESQVEEKGNYRLVHRLALLKELVRLRQDVVFLVAEVEKKIVAGGLFFRDGDSLFYWHAAMNRQYDKFYPACAIIDAAIQQACIEGFTTFNMGGCAGLVALERFKTFWGSSPRKIWTFNWQNSFWKLASQLKRGNQSTSMADEIGQFQTSGPSWSERAHLKGLQAVLSPTGTTRRNGFLHGVHTQGAFRALRYLPEGGHIVDFGCGTGRFTRYFSSRGRKILATEITPEMIESAKEECPPGSAEFVLTDGIHIPAADASLDGIWCCGVLRYSRFGPNPVYDKIAREMFRVLRPGAFVVNLEIYVDVQPEIFTDGFEEAGFKTKRCLVLQRYNRRLERTASHNRVPDKWLHKVAWTSSFLRSSVDIAERQLPGLRDYMFIWQKPKA